MLEMVHQLKAIAAESAIAVNTITKVIADSRPFQLFLNITAS